MKVSTEVAVANRDGKTILLELDTDTGEVAITTPAIMLAVPRVRLADLQAAVEEMTNAPLLRVPREER